MSSEGLIAAGNLQNCFLFIRTKYPVALNVHMLRTKQAIIQSLTTMKNNFDTNQFAAAADCFPVDFQTAMDIVDMYVNICGSGRARRGGRPVHRPLDGDYITHEGQKYYCCEPTSNAGRAGDRRWKKYVVTRLDKIR